MTKNQSAEQKIRESQETIVAIPKFSIRKMDATGNLAGIWVVSTALLIAGAILSIWNLQFGLILVTLGGGSFVVYLMEPRT